VLESPLVKGGKHTVEVMGQKSMLVFRSKFQDVLLSGLKWNTGRRWKRQWQNWTIAPTRSWTQFVFADHRTDRNAVAASRGENPQHIQHAEIFHYLLQINGLL